MSSTIVLPTCQGQCPKTANLALAHATLPMGLKLADSGLAAFDDPHLLAGLNVHHVN